MRIQFLLNLTRLYLTQLEYAVRLITNFDWLNLFIYTFLLFKHTINHKHKLKETNGKVRATL